MKHLLRITVGKLHPRTSYINRFVVVAVVFLCTAEAIARDANSAAMFIYLFSDNKGTITRYQVERKIF